MFFIETFFTLIFQAQNVMFPNLHPAAMVSPMGMGLAFNPQVPMQPHMRVPGPGSFMSGGFYGPSGFNGAPVPPTKSGSNSTPITHPAGTYTFTEKLF